MTPQIASLWLEFEEWEPPDEVPDFFNMMIRLHDGREYALNVWTFAFVEQLRKELHEERSAPVFTVGPDLIVDVADRPTLEAIADRLVQEQSLRDEWLVREDDTPIA
ncbi:hypothetical protein [Polyangium sp. 15x6]|uniref:hypothetical protein n=1 Tax=Polyangium sp. 15x6 TaxID=3042687 RepID=UPI00249A26C0|nr:hypothetical protein [Polyangium sp. 15x6]MDI3284323.1 hypothetical protein [Polyangium sp. 15x6]